MCLRICANAVDVGMTAMLDNIHEGISEMELSRICMDKYMELGADDIPYFPLVVSGEHSWQGYRHPTERRLNVGDMVWMDAGCCIINGYNGDIARTCASALPPSMTCSGRALRRCSPERPWTRRSRLLTAPPISMGCWIKCTLEFWATVLGRTCTLLPLSETWRWPTAARWSGRSIRCSPGL
mgnify:CR=1 FL=1